MKKEYLIRALPFLSAILAWLSYPSADLSFLAWVSYLPLLFYISEISKQDGFFRRRFVFIAKPGFNALWPVYLAGFLFFVLGLFWLRHVTWVGLIIIPSVLALYWLVFAIGGYFIMRGFSIFYAAFLMPALWVCLEYLRSFLLTGFPWLFAGHTQYRWLTFIQIADLAGVYGISFIILFVNMVILLLVYPAHKTQYHNASCYETKPVIYRSRSSVLQEIMCWVYPHIRGFGAGVKERFRVLSRPVGLVVITAIIFTSVLLYGANRLKGLTAKEGPVIGIVQANIEQSLKVDPDNMRNIYDKHFDLTMELLKTSGSPDLVVWAETMFPVPVGLEEESLKILRETVALCGVPMLIGALTVTTSENEIRRYDIFNSAYYLDDNGDVLNRYDKRHLVPISEYVPLRDTRMFKVIKNVITSLSELKDVYGMLEGANPEPFILNIKRDAKTADYRYGVLICYESVFPELASDSVKRGADFIINISNDGWFRDSSELEQILAISAFRAVENKTAFVRATNTGISAVIQPSGRIDAFRNQDGKAKEIEGIWSISLPVSGQKGTFYTRSGDYFPYICLLAAAVIIVLKYLKILDPAHK